MQTRELAPRPAPVEEPIAADEETYQFGSPTGRIALAVLSAAWGIWPLVLPHGGGWLLTILWTIPCTLAALGTLGKPYEVRISTTGRVRFVRLLGGDHDINAADIVSIVRYERPRSQALDHFEVVHRHGSVTVDIDREEVFERLRALNPASQVSAEVYDPD